MLCNGYCQDIFSSPRLKKEQPWEGGELVRGGGGDGVDRNDSDRGCGGDRGLDRGGDYGRGSGSDRDGGDNNGGGDDHGDGLVGGVITDQ